MGFKPMGKLVSKNTELSYSQEYVGIKNIAIRILEISCEICFLKRMKFRFLFQKVFKVDEPSLILFNSIGIKIF